LAGRKVAGLAKYYIDRSLQYVFNIRAAGISGQADKRTHICRTHLRLGTN
jgi:hypothetical protein